MKEIRVVSQSEKASMIFQKKNYINKQDQCIELTRTKILTKTKDEQRPNTQNSKTDRVDETILLSGIEGRLLVKSLHLCVKVQILFYKDSRVQEAKKYI